MGKPVVGVDKIIDSAVYLMNSLSPVVSEKTVDSALTIIKFMSDNSRVPNKSDLPEILFSETREKFDVYPVIFTNGLRESIGSFLDSYLELNGDEGYKKLADMFKKSELVTISPKRTKTGYNVKIKKSAIISILNTPMRKGTFMSCTNDNTICEYIEKVISNQEIPDKFSDILFDIRKTDAVYWANSISAARVVAPKMLSELFRTVDFVDISKQDNYSVMSKINGNLVLETDVYYMAYMLSSYREEIINENKSSSHGDITCYRLDVLLNISIVNKLFNTLINYGYPQVVTGTDIDFKELTSLVFGKDLPESIRCAIQSDIELIRDANIHQIMSDSYSVVASAAACSAYVVSLQRALERMSDEEKCAFSKKIMTTLLASLLTKDLGMNFNARTSISFCDGKAYVYDSQQRNFHSDTVKIIINKKTGSLISTRLDSHHAINAFNKSDIDQVGSEITDIISVDVSILLDNLVTSTFNMNMNDSTLAEISSAIIESSMVQ